MKDSTTSSPVAVSQQYASSSSSSSVSIDLAVVSAEDLALHLLHHRFEGNELATTQFLLESVSSLPNAQATSDLLLQAADEADEKAEDVIVVNDTNNTSSALGDSLLNSDSVEVSCIQPRSKFDVSFCEQGLLFKDRKEESFTIAAAADIQHVVVFPKPEDCRSSKGSKKSFSDIVLLVFNNNNNGESSVSYKSKKLKQVCLQLPIGYPEWKDTDGKDHRDDDNGGTTAAWMRVLEQCLGFAVENMTRVYNPVVATNNGSSNNVFCSHRDDSTSTTVSGMPFVSCYHGVNDGVLFPLASGLLFFKPPSFLHRSTLHSIDCTGSNRYVTFTVVTTDDTNHTQATMEFTNIHKQEQDVLRKYIHGTLIPAMQQDVDDAGKDGDDDDDERDEQLIPAANSNKRQKRKASVEAATVNKRIQQQLLPDGESDEEEDDEDYGVGAASDEDDDDDESSDNTDEDDDPNENGDEHDGDDAQATETESEEEYEDE
jgi:Histone chaperone Rttp106-like